jgi:hypothetical protein
MTAMTGARLFLSTDEASLLRGLASGYARMRASYDAAHETSTGFMKLRGLLPAIALLALSTAIHADVTVHYKNNIDLGTAGQLMGPAAAQMKSALPDSTVIRAKGKKVYTTALHFSTVMDFTNQQITLIDQAHNQFVTVYMKDYADQVLSSLPGASPPTSGLAQKALEGMKVDFSSEKTGKTDTVLGIQVEETAITLAIAMPPPASTRPSQQPQAAESVPLVRVVIHMWTALPSEVQRIAALQELSTVLGDPRTDTLMNPAEIWGKAFASSPGMAKGFSAMMDEFSQKKAVMLRTQVEMFMPLLARVLQQRPAGGNGGASAQTPSLDPNAALFEMQSEADQISTAAIDASVFDVPRDCKAVTVADFLKGVTASLAPTGSEPPAAPATPPQSEDSPPSH